ncbi:peptide ABC transporter permease [Devosia epidermidihirudinis]|uniref:Peptide ABC transporter permease n=1 Tax=Devosia epidermidihirudinis TaxID=1293439 RepID=A0A0F5QN19_9HYPH|nr:ABC transporter permease [Devosia epidermidihirudinis]KKC41454.1 peptide ABC transporter permease [Devosia epidermidihirudinis]
MTDIAADAISAAPAAKAERTTVLSVRQLTWRKFLRNKLAVVGLIILVIMYLSALLAGFIAPYGDRETHGQFARQAPHGLNFFDETGAFHPVPFVYGLKRTLDPKTFQQVTTIVPEQKYPLQLFVKGQPYSILGLIKSDIRLFGVEAPGKLFIFGTDTKGRDVFSRILYGAQVSLTVGLVGVALSLLIGVSMGLITGYFGGWFDNVVQRVIEMTMAFPQIPLWLALAALIPPTWSSAQVYFAISIVLSVLTWGSLARQVRAMVLSLKTSDFVRAAKYSNASTARVMVKHLLPSTMSHVLVIATLTIPSMILGETALSFLGLGIKPPMTSWGLLLNEAQSVQVIIELPWLLIPAIFVVLTIISFNFVGDGMRDAADPFSR